MLKGIDHRLNADLLYVLRSMGHGDVLAVVDANFPGHSVAKHTVHGSVLRLDNLTSPQAVTAILSAMPLDTFVDDFAVRMQVVGDASASPEVQQQVQAEIDQAEGRPRPMISIDRFAFYDQAKQAFAVVQTSERRLYGCFLLRKGIIAPDA